MNWRFWEPPSRGPDLLSQQLQLPPRKLNLTELRVFAEAMAVEVGAQPDHHSLEQRRPYDAADPTVRFDPVTWRDVEGMLPEERDRVVIEAKRPPSPEAAGMAIPDVLTLQLGDGLAGPATLAASLAFANHLPDLERRWVALGQPRPTRSWVYPSLFLLGLVLAVSPLVVLWVVGDLSLWLIPFVAAIVLLAFATGAPQLQRAVAAHRVEREGLEIDWRLLDRVRLDAAAQRQRWITGAWSGLVGAVVGALLAAALAAL